MLRVLLRGRAAAVAVSSPPTLRPLLARSFATEKRFTESHEVVSLDASTGEATVGITKYAANALGVGDSFAAGDIMVALESVKAAADVYAPIAGEVAALNEALVDEPSLLNDGDEPAWLLRLKATEKDGGAPFKAMMDAKAYSEFCAAMDEDAH